VLYRRTGLGDSLQLCLTTRVYATISHFHCAKSGLRAARLRPIRGSEPAVWRPRDRVADHGLLQRTGAYANFDGLTPSVSPRDRSDSGPRRACDPRGIPARAGSAPGPARARRTACRCTWTAARSGRADASGCSSPRECPRLREERTEPLGHRLRCVHQRIDLVQRAAQVHEGRVGTPHEGRQRGDRLGERLLLVASLELSTRKRSSTGVSRVSSSNRRLDVEGAGFR
jgi:hypothetical protein